MVRPARHRARAATRAWWRGRVAASIAVVAVAVAPSASVASGAPPRHANTLGAPVVPWTIVAKVVHPAPKYASATATVAHGTIPLTWRGAASILPVLRNTSTRLLVRLAQRPNGGEAWIPSKDAQLSRSPYEIVIHLHTTHLALFRRGHGILSAPIGVGTSQYPTPTGHFFVAFFASAPSSGYGPFVIVTSGHSNTITNWEYSGDAMVAIHGPLGADAAIGKTGARVSHGCIRMHTAALRLLRPVPAGSPVYIVN